MGNIVAYGILGLLALSAIVSLVCLIMIIVKMFQHGSTGLGVTTILLTLCTGIGPLIAFIVGWVKVGEWGTRNVMVAWTGSVVITIILVLAGPSVLGERANMTFTTVGNSLSGK